jgi:hypothetical protein
VQKPYEGSSSSPNRLAGWMVEVEQKPIETLGRRRHGVSLAAKRVRGGQAKSWPRRLPTSPGRVKPKGATSGWRIKHTLIARDSRKG